MEQQDVVGEEEEGEGTNVFPRTTFFRVLRSLFMTLLVLSSITASLLALSLLLALFTLIDWDNWGERSSLDSLYLFLSVSFLLLVCFINVVQVYVGWIGIQRQNVHYLAGYLAFESVCFVMWFLCFLFWEDKSLPTFKMMTSFSSLLITLIMVHQVMSA
jgi:hypothetical protein